MSSRLVGPLVAVTAGSGAAQVRLHGVVYTSNGYTGHRATRYAAADRAQRDDMGADPRGSVFPDHPQQVTTWAFRGYPPDKVLAVRVGKGSFAVFVAGPRGLRILGEALATRGLSLRS
jgi:hypothetical protein